MKINSARHNSIAKYDMQNGKYLEIFENLPTYVGRKGGQQTQLKMVNGKHCVDNAVLQMRAPYIRQNMLFYINNVCVLLRLSL